MTKRLSPSTADNEPTIKVFMEDTKDLDSSKKINRVVTTIINGVSVKYDESIPLDTILVPNDKRLVLHPIEHPGIWKLYKKAERSFWVADEVKLDGDVVEYRTKLTSNEKRFLDRLFGFFGGFDGLVIENLARYFIIKLQYPEARNFLGLQIAIEGIHSDFYSGSTCTILSDDIKKRDSLLNGINEIPSIKKKADWVNNIIKDSDLITHEGKSFALKMFISGIVEGIFFSGSFCALFWLKKRGLMHGLTYANEKISGDEGLHVQFNILIYKEYLKNSKLNEDEAVGFIKQAVDIEIEFIEDGLPVNLIGMNKDQMATYIKFVADRFLVECGYSAVYNVENPFDWMDMISMQGKSNIYEKLVAEYQVSGISINTNENEKLVLSNDF